MEQEEESKGKVQKNTSKTKADLIAGYTFEKYPLKIHFRKHTLQKFTL